VPGDVRPYGRVVVEIHADAPFGYAFIVFLLSGSFVPTIVAMARGARFWDRLWVFALNLFLGWTLLGWLFALYLASREIALKAARAS
jgi:hypothetical protein